MKGKRIRQVQGFANDMETTGLAVLVMVLLFDFKKTNSMLIAVVLISTSLAMLGVVLAAVVLPHITECYHTIEELEKILGIPYSKPNNQNEKTRNPKILRSED